MTAAPKVAASSDTTRKFAVFDIDGTLIRWQLYHAITNRLGKAGQLAPADFAAIQAARMDWKNRHTNTGFHAYETRLVEILQRSLPRINPKIYDQVVLDVFNEYKDQVFTYTRDLIMTLKEEHCLLFAISGSPQEVIRLLAEYHGFDAAIGGVFEREGGAFTGKSRTPIFDKRSALDKLVAQFGASYEDSYAVGDSASDAPMLEAVDNPIAFSPDQNLYEIAREKGWKIVVERKNVVYEL